MLLMLFPVLFWAKFSFIWRDVVMSWIMTVGIFERKCYYLFCLQNTKPYILHRDNNRYVSILLFYFCFCFCFCFFPTLEIQFGLSSTIQIYYVNGENCLFSDEGDLKLKFKKKNSHHTQKVSSRRKYMWEESIFGNGCFGGIYCDVMISGGMHWKQLVYLLLRI